ncbi:MAG: TIM barrel protein [Patescibacteria group bacterium]
MKKIENRRRVNINHYGFMPDFEEDIFEEIAFAKQNFSFIEFTLRKDLKNYSEKKLNDIKQTLKIFKVFGHLHWEIDLLNFKLTMAHLEAYRFLGVKQITIHPQVNANLNPYIDFCRKNKIVLLVENSIKPPFNSINTFKILLSRYPSLKITLDLGHTLFKGNDSYKKFFQLFAKSIKHIHLHYTYKHAVDHLPFRGTASLIKFLAELEKYCIKPTITLEIFEQFVEKNKKALSGQERHKVLIQQASLVNSSQNLLPKLK